LEKNVFGKIVVTSIILVIMGVGFESAYSMSVYPLKNDCNLADTVTFQEDILIDGRSTTGPLPPLNINDGLNPNLLTGKKIISDVPAYKWRHGCGPTAAGMVIGYWDFMGHDYLVPGDASTQTSAVNQIIASGGSDSDPYPPGSEQHYEDYGRPEDEPPYMLTDDYITKHRAPHGSNSIADFMDTSKSTRGNYYGWSKFSDCVNALIDYVHWVNPQSDVYASNNFWTSSLWNKYCYYIDLNYPVLLLVDSNGDGYTDHLVTGIGYDDSHNYACYNTWDRFTHWYDFTEMTYGNDFGVYGATFFKIENLGANARGPYEGICNMAMSFTGNAIGGTPPYEWHWDFGDGHTANNDQNPSHVYAESGNYTVVLTVTDDNNDAVSDTTWALVINTPPAKPSISGQTYGNEGSEYYYVVKSTDENNDEIRYIIDWDDGYVDTTDFYASGMHVDLKHVWNSEGTFIIKVKAEDPFGLTSPEATLYVTMPRTNIAFNTFIERLSFIFPSLQGFCDMIRQ
jgi:hypothetical protein